MSRSNKPVALVIIVNLILLFLGPTVTGQDINKIAFIVGVSEYQKDGLPDLQFAHKDANDQAAALEQLGFTVIRLIGDDATHEAITENFSEFIAKTKTLAKKDIVLVSFSGHGIQTDVIVKNGNQQAIVETPFFCASDSLVADTSTLISLNEVVKQLATSGSSNNLLIVDACRNNPARGVVALDGGAIQNLPPKLSLLFSCSAGQKSYEFQFEQNGDQGEPNGQGVFTHVFLKGLKGAAKNVRNEVNWPQLAGYVVAEVPRNTQELLNDPRLEQQPNWVSNISGAPILAQLRPEPRPTPPNPIDPPAVIPPSVVGESVLYDVFKANTMASSIERLNVEPFEQAMLHLVLAENANRSGANSDAHIKTALKMATRIEDALQAMECSYIIAKTIASRENFSEDDLKQLKTAITQVRFDLEGIVANRRDKGKIWVAKYATLLKCASLYWKVGQRKLADEYGQLAYAKTSSSSQFYSEISVFQAMMIFSMAGDTDQVAQFQHIRDGRVNFKKNSGRRKYRSLMDASLFSASDHSSDAGFHETLCQTVLAMTFAKAGDSNRARVHFRNGQQMATAYTTGESTDATLKSQSQALLAIAEAHQEEYVAAKRRLESLVENSGMLAEAALEVGKVQLSSNDDSDQPDIDEVLELLAIFENDPRATLLAFEIGQSYGKANVDKAMAWANGLSAAQKFAASWGVVSSRR